MLGAPLAQAKMRYDATTSTVIYLFKIPLGSKRNFQVMQGTQWLDLLPGLAVLVANRRRLRLCHPRSQNLSNCFQTKKSVKRVR